MTRPYYSDGRVTLYHGDCREVTEWLSADVLVTDPPYGYSHSSNWDDSAWRNTVIAGDDSTAARDRVVEMWGDRPGLVFGSWKCSPVRGTRAVLVWDKGLASGMGDLSLPWKPNWESVYVLGAGFSGRRDSAIITGNVVTWTSKGRYHPNQKPVGLMEKLLAKCPPGTVADPFAGSGSTVVAARNAGRCVIACELEERYCETIARRLAQDSLFAEVAE